MPDEKWRHIVDDFAATFSITRHSLLESLTFYLLDDHTDEALQVTSIVSFDVLWVLFSIKALDVHLTNHYSNAETVRLLLQTLINDIFIF